MPLPMILAGPILRRVEPGLVAVWVALKDSSIVKLSLWEGQIEAPDPEELTPWFRSPDPGARTIRLGDKLHVVVVTLRLPEDKTLVREQLYSYDLEITPDGQTTKHTLKSLGLLNDDPPNADPDGDHTKRLALGYETNMLPCIVLPPKELKDLKIVHGSCRDPDNSFPDGLAWVDDLLSNGKAYSSPINRPHQLFLTGDQIYADEVPRPFLKMLNDAVKELFGSTVEQLPLRDTSDLQKTIAVPADLVHFPVGRRENLIRNEAGMTTTAGDSHLMSFGEFCAMHVSVWSNELRNALSPDAFPPPEDLPPKVDGEVKLPDTVKNAITKNNAGEVIQFLDYESDNSGAPSYETDKARLTEFYRTLPKVRRALANVPTYMIFDDHEITDDWYLNPTWRDRVLGSPLGSAIIRNGMLAYALFQGWGNDPVKFEPRAGLTEKQPHELLLEQAAKFMPAGAPTGPDADAAKQIEHLLGLDLRNEIALDGSYAETNPPMKWHYTVPGAKHEVIVLDCRTRRSFASRVSPPGNIGLTAQAEQIPETPPGGKKDVYIVVASLPVIGPPIFDELFAPLLFRAFDALKGADLQKDRGTKRMPGTNPDAEEAWCFDPKLFEALLSRLLPYSPVVFLSGDVHYSASNAMSYWKSETAEPARFVQFISSGFKNVMPKEIRFVSRTFALAQKMIRAGVGAERLGWKQSADVLDIPAGANISPKLTGALRKSPILIPTTGWRGATVKTPPDWAWRVVPLRDTRPNSARPKPAQPDTLFPDDAAKTNDDIGKALNLEQYHRVAARHSRQLEKLSNSRQVLFASSLGMVTFQNKNADGNTASSGDVLYAIHDLYTAVVDPADLTNRPKPLLYTHHEAALRDVEQTRPDIRPPKKV
jgi:hypothetical protein